MNILALDTATDVLSVALQVEDVLIETTRTGGYEHSERLVPVIQWLLAEGGISFSDLNLIVYSRGPGSFTGLRIGAATAKGFSLGWYVPVVSIPTLDAYAYPHCFFPGAVVPLLDAKKRRYYSAVYTEGKRIGEYADISAENLVSSLSAHERVLFTGPGSILLKERTDIETSGFSFDPFPLSGKGASLLALGIRQFRTEGADPEGSGPVYIRPSEAEIARNV